MKPMKDQSMPTNVNKHASLTLLLLLWVPELYALDIPLTLGLSTGQEIQFKPPPMGQARATSLTFSPGYHLSDSLRLEVGFSYIQDTYRRGKVDAEIRPSLRLQLPGYSYYGRFNLGFVHLIDGEKGEGRPSIGVALGQKVTVANVPFHFEIGVNPRTEKTKKDKFRLFWITEFRFGFSYNLKD
jgi:hypothetical protein